MPDKTDPIPLAYARAPRRRALWPRVTGIVALAIAFAFLGKALLEPRSSRSRAMLPCTANLRQIGQSLHIYANDFDGLFPPSLQTLIDSGAAKPENMKCPANHKNTAGIDYKYVAGLDWSAPPTWIIAFEGASYHRGPGRNVLYVDAHVEFLEPARLAGELERVRREIEASEYGIRPEYSWPQ